MKIKAGPVCLCLAAALLSPATATAGSRVDANGDGKLTLAEFQSMARERLMRADTSADGRISLEDWKARSAATKAKGDPARMFRRIDVNNDSFIDASEIDLLLKRRFDRIDANADGTLSQEELLARKAAAAKD